MTIKEWKEELDCYDDDMEVCFEFDDDIDVESWTENIYGQKQVHIGVTNRKGILKNETIHD